MLAHDALDRGPGEGRLARQHLVKHAAQGVEIAPAVDVPFPRRLFRAHVRRCPHREAGIGESLGASAGQPAGDSEIRHQGVAALQQDVLRLDVPVDHPPAVSVAQGIGHFAGDAERVLDGQLLLPVQSVTERLALD